MIRKLIQSRIIVPTNNTNRNTNCWVDVVNTDIHSLPEFVSQGILFRGADCGGSFGHSIFRGFDVSTFNDTAPFCVEDSGTLSKTVNCVREFSQLNQVMRETLQRNNRNSRCRYSSGIPCKHDDISDDEIVLMTGNIYWKRLTGDKVVYMNSVNMAVVLVEGYYGCAECAADSKQHSALTYVRSSIRYGVALTWGNGMAHIVGLLEMIAKRSMLITPHGGEECHEVERCDAIEGSSSSWSKQMQKEFDEIKEHPNGLNRCVLDGLGGNK